MTIEIKKVFAIFRREGKSRQALLKRFTTVFLILFGICYIPLEGRVGFGAIKLTLMFLAIIVMVLYSFKLTKAVFIGIVYVLYLYFSASFHPESFRWSTLLFSFGFVFTYAAIYNLIYVERVFSVRHFLRLVKWIMMAFFVVCIMQQCCIAVGIRTLPWINLTEVLNRGIGCNSLSMEPSTFARTMLVFYYCYVKCHEYIRGEGPFTVRELFSGEHKWVTIRFLWMMTTMGSGTAYVCLVLFCLYFVRRHNFYYIVPILAVCYIGLEALELEQATRATKVLNAMTTLDQKQVEMADGSGASRISPLLNSFKADFSKSETWFGYGIDYAVNHNMVVLQTATLFDDYGFCLYLIALVMNLTCAYRLSSLGFLFQIGGVAGGAGGNIHYAWWLMMIMTCLRFFYDNRHQLKEEYDRENVEHAEG